MTTWRCGRYYLVSPKLFGIALRTLMKRGWTEEVLQEPFVNIWRQAEDDQSSLSSPMTSMVAIVRNRAIDFLRRQKALGAGAQTEWTESLDDTLPVCEAGPSDLLLMSQEARQLARCMGRLGASQRHAVALAYLHDQSHAEIAHVLNVPPGTVKSWIRHGVEKLRACVGTP